MNSASKLIGTTERSDYEKAVAAEAIRYTATRFLGRGKYDTRDSETIEGARSHAREMGIERTMIYAINGDGRQVLIEAAGEPVKG